MTSSSTGARAFASSGTIQIANAFTVGTNTYNSIGLSGDGYTPQNSSFSISLLGVSAVSATNCFMSGLGGSIITTTNGGTTWTQQTSTTINDLYGICFIDANTGVAVGNTGTIVRTTNGGGTWAAVTSGTTEHLRSITFISSTVGFATGANGVILKTTDAGATWSSLTTGTTQVMYSVSFTTSSVGFASGATGTILKTTNGGTSWSTLTSGTTENLTSLQFMNTSMGVAAGANGKIVRTIDGGVTWNTITSGTSDNFSILGFVDINNGFIAGGNITNNTSTLMKTTDGGITWTNINPGTTRMYGIDIVDATTAYITALDGNIIKYTCCNDGSTVDFNGSGTQTIPALNYNNLTISGSRGANNVTLASSGTIGIAGTLTKTATFSGGASIVNSGSTVEFNGNKTQGIAGITFNNLTTSGIGTKSASGNIIVGGSLNLSSAEIAMAGNTLTMSSSTYSTVTRTSGYLSTTGSGNITRPTNSINPYLFPIGYKTLNNSADYFVISLTPGKTAAQQFTASLHSTNTGIVLSYDKTLYGTGTETVPFTVTTSSYSPIQFEFDINTSANISAVRVLDQNDNTLKTLPSSYYTITGGNQLAIPNIYQLCIIYSKLSANLDLNWDYEIAYDGNGLPVSEQIQYADLLGRPTQTQVRSIADNNVIVSQTVYDNYSDAALKTLPAPIGSVMAFQSNFITNLSGATYTYTDFDKPTTTSNYIGEINNPSTVSTSQPGTLGWYYSNNNTSDNFQATTAYPYSRNEMTAGARSALPGDEFRMGAGHESKGYSMVSGDELRFIFGTNKSYKSSIDVSDKLVNSSLTITGGIVAEKSLSKDADGKEMISYSYDGLQIATCYTGISGACSMSTVTNSMLYAGTSSTDIHVPSANKSSVKLPLPQYDDGGRQTVSSSDITFKITDLSTNAVLISGTDYTISGTTPYGVTFLGAYASGSSVFRISFVYSSTKLTYFAAHSITPPDATVTYDLDYSRWSVNYYDLAGNLRKSVSPKGINCSSAGTITIATTYDYSSLGQLIATNDPDAGKKEITYDDEEKPRFTQDAVQHAANKFSYVNYDVHGRTIENGESASSNNGSASVFFQNYYAAYSAPYSGNTASSSIINNTGNTGMRTADCSNNTNVYYYPMDPAENMSTSYSYKNLYLAKYQMGNVCKTKNAQNATWYGYDQSGHTVFTVQQFLDGDYATYNSTIDSKMKTIDYNFNAYNGTLTDQTYQKNETTEELKHNFYYDSGLRLTQVDVAIGIGSAVTQAKYYYTPTGALKRQELGDKLQGIDYVYTINGQLKSINNPSLSESEDPGMDGLAGKPNSAFGKDVFGLTLDYHALDYIRSNSNIRTSNDGSGGGTNFYSGLISATHYKTRATTNSVNNGADYIDYGGANQAQVVTGTTDEIMNQYAYDDENRLSIGKWGKFVNNTSTFTENASFFYKEYGTSSASGIDYDANGNITSLRRNGYISGSTNIKMDDFTYTYTSNTNKLASIVDAIADNKYTNDFDAATSKTFTYNSNGEMTASQAEGVSTIDYYNSGLTKKVTFSNNNTAEYWYNDRNQKIKTKFYDNTSTKAKFTWYANDDSGNSMAIYEYDQAAGTPAFSLVDQPLYGNGRIGVLDKTTGIIEYELTDNLGNVRATIKGVSTGVCELTTRTDYYAFGGAQPGRTYNLNAYRYNYQGQECAVNTNWEMFDLRMHNSDLGRWFAPDPEGQFYSPYISMGNNPVGSTDPDGGYASVNVPHTENTGNCHMLKVFYEGPNASFLGKYVQFDSYNTIVENDKRMAFLHWQINFDPNIALDLHDRMSLNSPEDKEESGWMDRAQAKSDAYWAATSAGEKFDGAQWAIDNNNSSPGLYTMNKSADGVHSNSLESAMQYINAGTSASGEIEAWGGILADISEANKAWAETLEARAAAKEKEYFANNDISAGPGGMSADANPKWTVWQRIKNHFNKECHQFAHHQLSEKPAKIHRNKVPRVQYGIRGEAGRGGTGNDKILKQWIYYKTGKHNYHPPGDPKRNEYDRLDDLYNIEGRTNFIILFTRTLRPAAGWPQ